MRQRIRDDHSLDRRQPSNAVEEGSKWRRDSCTVELDQVGIGDGDLPDVTPWPRSTSTRIRRPEADPDQIAANVLDVNPVEPSRRQTTHKCVVTQNKANRGEPGLASVGQIDVCPNSA